MDKDDIAWTSDAGSFKYRSAAVILCADRILLCAVDHIAGWFLPGGKIHFGESSATALARELREELSFELVVSGAPLLIAEGIRDGDGTLEQEICFYYAVTWPSDLPPESVTDTGGHRFRWVLREDLSSLRFLPPEIVAFLTDGGHLSFDRRSC